MLSHTPSPNPSERVEITFDPAMPEDISASVFDELQSIWGHLDPLNRSTPVVNRATLENLLAVDNRITTTGSHHLPDKVRIIIKSSALKNLTPSTGRPVDNLEPDTPIEKSPLVQAYDIASKIRDKLKYRSFAVRSSGTGYEYLYRGRRLPITKNLSPISYEEAEAWARKVRRIDDNQRFSS